MWLCYILVCLHQLMDICHSQALGILNNAAMNTDVIFCDCSVNIFSFFLVQSWEIVSLKEFVHFIGM